MQRLCPAVDLSKPTAIDPLRKTGIFPLSEGKIGASYNSGRHVFMCPRVWCFSIDIEKWLTIHPVPSPTLTNPDKFRAMEVAQKDHDTMVEKLMEANAAEAKVREGGGLKL